MLEKMIKMGSIYEVPAYQKLLKEFREMEKKAGESAGPSAEEVNYRRILNGIGVGAVGGANIGTATLRS